MAYPNLHTAIYSKLTAASTLTALVSTRVYYGLAPQGAALPYVIFTIVNETVTNDSPRDNVDALYQIEGVASSKASAIQIADVIHDVLHEGDLSVTGWSVYSLAAVGRTMIIETENAVQYFRDIREFRIRLDKN